MKRKLSKGDKVSLTGKVIAVLKPGYIIKIKGHSGRLFFTGRTIKRR